MEIIYIALLSILASMVGTISGFGTSTVMIPVLVLFLPPAETILLVAIIHWFGNIWKITLFKTGIQIRLILFFGVAGLLASYLGASLSMRVDNQFLLQILGGFLAAYAILLLLQKKFKVPAADTTAMAGGALSGFFAGLFGIGGAIRSMFLTAFDLSKNAYIATAGAVGLMVDTTRIVTYFTEGAQLHRQLWPGLVLFVVASFLGARLAKRIVDRIPQEKFRAIVALFLFAIGVKLIVWS